MSTKKEDVDREFNRILERMDGKYRVSRRSDGKFCVLRKKWWFFWLPMSRILTFDCDEILAFPNEAQAFAFISLLEGGDKELLKGIYELVDRDWELLDRMVEEERVMQGAMP